MHYSTELINRRGISNLSCSHWGKILLHKQECISLFLSGKLCLEDMACNLMILYHREASLEDIVQLLNFSHKYIIQACIQILIRMISIILFSCWRMEFTLDKLNNSYSWIKVCLLDMADKIIKYTKACLQDILGMLRLCKEANHQDILNNFH